MAPFSLPLINHEFTSSVRKMTLPLNLHQILWSVGLRFSAENRFLLVLYQSGFLMCIIVLGSDTQIKGGVIAYPVMYAYGSLALDDNSEVGNAVLGRCSISCICTSAF